MNRTYIGNVTYTTRVAHDNERDCDSLELLWSCGDPANVVAEIFKPYRDRSWSLNTFDCDIPLELIEELLEEARSVLKYSGNKK